MSGSIDPRAGGVSATEPFGISGPGYLGPEPPHLARIYSAWLGGKDAYAVDRQIAQAVIDVAPWVQESARANRAFLVRAVRLLAQSGIDQFLDLGSGLPTTINLHEVVHAVNGTGRIVYVDLDPVVVSRARALLAVEKHTIAVQGDLRRPAEVLAAPAVRDHLDWSRPVAVLLGAVLHFVADDHAAVTVATWRDAVPPGSYFVISHAADVTDASERDRAAATREAAELYRSTAVDTFTLRTRQQIEGLFERLDLVPPGVVPVHLWRPQGSPGKPVPVLGGVGMVPNSRGAKMSSEIPARKAVLA